MLVHKQHVVVAKAVVDVSGYQRQQHVYERRLGEVSVPMSGTDKRRKEDEAVVSTVAHTA